MSWRQPGRRAKADLALALVVAAVSVAGATLAGRHQPERRGLDAGGVVLLLAASFALAARRRHPSAVLATTFAATLAYLLIGYPWGPVFGPLVVAYVTAVVVGARRWSWLYLPAGYASFLWLGALLGRADAPRLGAALGVAAWLLVLGAGAEVYRARRDRSAEAARRLGEQSRRVASEERLRVARELHDVLAHTISMINVQAGVALHLIDERPEQARPALAAIKQASREALGELRGVLDVLRANGEAPPRAPTAGLADLDAVVRRAAAAGLRVLVEVDGPRRALPAGVDLAAFRIVQEALTNVVRHAKGAAATVRLGYREGELTVQVDDDGTAGASTPAPWPASVPDGVGGGSAATSCGVGVSAASAASAGFGVEVEGGGNGLPGMRERVATLGGEFDAGPRPGGGFRVHARLPAGDGT